MKFVDEGPRLRRSVKKAGFRSSRMSSAQDCSPSPAVSTSMEAPGTCRKDHVPCPAVHATQPRTKWDVPVQQLSSSKLDRDQILSAFVSAMFPLGSSSVQSSFLGSWLWQVPSRLGSNALFDRAALSLALAYFARLSGDQAVLRNAELSYATALRSLVPAIADPSQQFGSEVLCAVLLLGHYEVCPARHGNLCRA